MELTHDQQFESLSKDAIEGAIEQEVARRVGEQQEVGEFPNAADEVATLVVVAEPEDRREDRVRCDADDEDNDDGHQHDCDATVAWRHVTADTVGRRRGRRDVLGRAAQGVDDEAIECGHDEQRNDGPQNVLNP